MINNYIPAHGNKEKDTPLIAKILAEYCRYALSPIDIVPDFVPVLGI